MKKLLRIIDVFLMIILAGLSIFLIYQVYGMLPAKLLAIAGGVLGLLVLLLGYFLLIRKKPLWFSRIVSILLSICLALGVMVVKKGLSTLDKVTTSGYETNYYSVIVLADSNYEYMSDLDGKNMGICSVFESDTFNEVVTETIGNFNISTTDYNGINDLYNALLNNEVEAILLNEGFRDTIDEIDDEFSNKTRVITETQRQVVVEDIVQENVNVTKDSYNIFISGIDTYGPVNTRSRSDVNMIVSINPTSKTILMTSIPRDYYVTLASYGQRDKLTHAGLYGVNESIQTLENLFGIDINYYARVNFTSLVTMVDALGGITVYNPEAFTSRHYKYQYSVGLIEMDGEHALEFARERYNLAGGDRSRVLNQQRVLQAMLEKAMSTSIIYNYNSVLNAISGCFETNMSSEEIQSIIAMQLDSMSSWHFKSQSVDGTGTTSTTCFSYSGPALYVMEPDMNTVNNATSQIKAIMG